MELVIDLMKIAHYDSVMERTEIQVEIMRASGLKDSEILNLAYLKRRVQDGDCNDLTLEYKRGQYLRHIWKRGRINEWAVARNLLPYSNI